MDFEKQITEILNVSTQMQQFLWKSWVETMRGWQETLERSTQVWTEAFRTATDAQLTIVEVVGKQVEENMQRAAARERKAA